MKAIVLTPGHEAPELQHHFPEPQAPASGQQLLTMKAAAIKHLDKGAAGGGHYAVGGKHKHPLVPGIDGVGLLPDGSRVYALGRSGMLAEKAMADTRLMVPVPDALDDVTAAALPNAVAGAAMALRFRAKMKPGATVLINGATSFTGTIAVQIAKHYGAKRVIVTGRNQARLQELEALGADDTIAIRTPAEFERDIRERLQTTPPDVILDYLWGDTAMAILNALQGSGGFTHPTQFVSVGTVTGDEITLSGALLRSNDLCISGSGLGSWQQEEVAVLLQEMLPEMFALAASGKLWVPTRQINLAEVTALWGQEWKGGERLVATM